MPWYKKLEESLLPAQGLVSILLIIIILVSIYALFSRNSVLRTAWVVYVLSP